MEIRPNRLRYCLENNIPTISTRIESPWAYMTELAAASGHFDFIEYEGEYAPDVYKRQVYIFTPCMILGGFLIDWNRDKITGMLIALVGSACLLYTSRCV